jgi:spoIIIJ-associated protein
VKKEVIVSAKTEAEAIEKAVRELGAPSADAIEYVVLEQAKKGLFGIGAADAKISATYNIKGVYAALDMIEKVVSDMGLDAKVCLAKHEGDEALITVDGEGAGILIGHHGDTLDSLQYLVNLAANKKETDERKYTRISIDIENYREKREETLKKLARHMAEKAKRTGRNVVLEPMNAYERRIIHSEVQGIEGASTNSVGVEGNRRVIIFPEGGSATKGDRKGGRNGKGRKDGAKKHDKAPKKEEAIAEADVTPAEKAPEAKRDRSEYTSRPRRNSDSPRPAPRKIEKAKDLDSYFARLKEFGSTINSTEDKK